MDKSLRNTFIGAIVTILIAFLGAWIQLNNRIAILEVQVQNDRETMIKTTSENEQHINEIKNLQQQILVGIQHLQDVKQDK